MPDRRVWALPSVVFDELGHQVIHVAGVQHDILIKAFHLPSPDEPLNVGVEVRRAVGDASMRDCADLTNQGPNSRSGGLLLIAGLSCLHMMGAYTPPDTDRRRTDPGRP